MTESINHHSPLATLSSGGRRSASLAYDDWCTLYAPVRNPVRPDAAFDGTLFETFGDDLAYVIQQPQERIWTLVQGGDGELYLINGFHRVDRLCYFVSLRPFEPDEVLEILVE